MKISTLSRILCTVAVGLAFLLGMSVSTKAQGPPGHAPAYGRRNARPYGQRVRARVHRRNALRRELRLHQRGERRILDGRLRTARTSYGNTPSWRSERRRERTALRLHQRVENRQFKERYNNRGRGRH